MQVAKGKKSTKFLALLLCFALIFSNFTSIQGFAETEEVLKITSQQQEDNTNRQTAGIKMPTESTEKNLRQEVTEPPSDTTDGDDDKVTEPNDEDDEVTEPPSENEDDEDDEVTEPSTDDEDDEDDEATEPSTDDEDDEATEPSTDDEDDEATEPSTDDEDDEATEPSTDDEDDEVTEPSTDDEDDEATEPSTDDEDDEATEPSTDDEDDEVTEPSTDDEDDEVTEPPSENEDGEDDEVTEPSSDDQLMTLMMVPQYLTELPSPNINQNAAYFYASDFSGRTVKIFPLKSLENIHHIEQVSGVDSGYTDIASSTGKLYGVSSGICGGLYEVKRGNDKKITDEVYGNALHYDGAGKFYFMKGTILAFYDINNDTVQDVIDVGYYSKGDLAFYNNDIYLLGKRKHNSHRCLLIRITHELNVEVVKYINNNSFGLAVCENNLYVAYDNKVQAINPNTGNYLGEAILVPGLGYIYGLAQANDDSQITYVPGYVYSQHYKINQLPTVSDEQKWRLDSHDIKLGLPVIKKSLTGRNNYTKNSTEAAFLKHVPSVFPDSKSKNAQKIYGYLIPQANITDIRVTTDDGVRFYLDSDLNNNINLSDLLIDKFIVQSKTTYETKVNLSRGTPYLYQISYFNWGGAGALYFEYKSDNHWTRVPANWWHIKLNTAIPFENTPPTIVVNPSKETIFYNNTSYNINHGVTVHDNEQPDLAYQTDDDNFVHGNTGDTEKVYNIKYTAEDAFGKKTEATRKVTILPNQAPVVEVNEPIINIAFKSEFNDSLIMQGVSAKDVDGSVQSLDYNIPIPIDTHQQNTSFIINYIAVDNDGKVGYGTKTVKIGANHKPKLTVPSSIKKILFGAPSINLLEDITATDVEDGNLIDQVVYNPKTIDTQIATTTEIIYTVSDNDGLTSEASRDYEVLNNNPPQLIVNNVTIEYGANFNESDYNNYSVSDVEDDAHALKVKVAYLGKVNTYQPNSYTISYTATDSAGAKVTKDRIVTVVDTKMPTINNEYPTVTIKLGTKYGLNEIMAGVSASDPVDGPLNVTYTGSVNTSIVAQYKITYSAKDFNNNEVTCTRIVNVADKTDPTLTVNPLRIVVLKGDKIDDYFMGVSATDNYDTDVKITKRGTANTNKEGDHKVTYIATDDSGNKTEVTRIYHVNYAPTIITNGVRNVYFGEKINVYSEITTNDQDGTVESVIAEPNTIDSKTVGATIVKYTVTDNDKAVTVGFKTFSVKQNNPPVLTIKRLNPNQLVDTVEYGASFEMFNGVSAKDKEDDKLGFKVEITYDNELDTSKVGIHSIEYTATDSELATDKKIRVIAVIDTNKPTITNKIANVDLLLGDTYNKADILAGVEAKDKVDGVLPSSNISYTIKDKNNQIVSEIKSDLVMNYTITYEAVDKHNNKSNEVTRTVSVKDKEAPVFEAYNNYIVVQQGATIDYLAGIKANDNYDSTVQIKHDGDINTKNPGEYTVTYTATDSSLNEAKIKRTYRVNAKPIINITNPSQEVYYGEQNIDVLAGVTANDSEDGDLTAVIDVDLNTIDSTIVGSKKVTYEVVDKDGAKTIATKTFTVLPNKQPVLTVNAINEPIKFGSKFDTLTGVSATDYEDKKLGLDVDIKFDKKIDTTTAGNQTITYTATDSAGAKVTKSRTVTVAANTAPVITFKNNETVITFEYGVVVTKEMQLNNVEANDNEDGVITDITTDAEAKAYAVGDHIITYTAKDKHDLVGTNSRTMRIKDTEAPVLTNKIANVDLVLGDTYPKAKILAGVEAKDKVDGVLPCSNISYTIKDKNNQIVSEIKSDLVMNYTITYEAVDKHNNKSNEVTRTVSVKDKEAPVFEAYNNYIVVQQGATIDYLAGIKANDNYDSIVEITHDGKINTDSPGEYTVTYTATDSSLNEAKIKRTYRVNAKPIIHIANPSQEVYYGEQNIDVLAGVTANDSEDGDLTAVIDVDLNTIDSTIVGSKKVTYEVVDKDGAKTIATKTFTVLPNKQPVLTVNAINEPIKFGSKFDTLTGVSATDYEDKKLGLDVDIKFDKKIDTTTAGNQTITYTATDSAGAKVTKSRTVTVAANTAPVITFKNNETVITFEYGVVVTKEMQLNNVEANDNEDGVITDITTDAEAKAYAVGDHIITYTAKDKHDLVGTNSRTMRIKDTEAPVLTNKIANVDLVLGDTYPKAKILAGVEAKDKVDGVLPSSSISYTIKDKNNQIVSEIKSDLVMNYTITYEAVDKHNNKSNEVTRTVSVKDKEAPVFEAYNNYIVVQQGATIDYLAGIKANDNYDSTVQIKHDGDINTKNPGEYIVTYTATDSSLNEAKIKRTYRVNAKPIIHIANPSQEVYYGEQNIDVLAGVTANDSEDGDLTAVIDVDLNTIDSTIVGSKKVTYEVVDKDGAKTIATKTFTVLPNKQPVLTVNAINEPIKFGSKFDTLTGVSATDYEDKKLGLDVDIKFDKKIDTTTAGNQTITYTATDSAGAKVTKSRTVTVAENTAPVITFKNNETVITFEYGVVVTKEMQLNNVEANDNEDGVITDITTDAEAKAYAVGDHIITYTAKDKHDLVGTNSRTMRIKDTEAPVLTNKIANVDLVLGDTYPKAKILAGVEAKDKVDGVLPSSSISYTIKDKNNQIVSEIKSDLVMNYTITYKAVDKHNNKSNEVTRTVSVKDKEAPVFEAYNNYIVVQQGATIDYLAGIKANDNYDSTVQIKHDGDINTKNPGEYIVTYTATDSSLNEAKIKRTYRVNAKPIIHITNPSQEVYYGEQNIDVLAGVTANDSEDGDLTAVIDVDLNTIDSTIVGSKKVTYEVVDKDGAKTIATKTFTVLLNKQPVLTVNAINEPIKFGSKFDTLTGVSATDYEDKKLGLDVDIKFDKKIDTTTAGNQTITYTATDSAGAKVTKSRTVTVAANTAPVITFKNNETVITFEYGVVVTKEMQLNNVEANDNEDGVITDITTDAEAKAYAVGDHTITYTAKDKHDLVGTNSRTMTIEDTEAPVIENNLAEKTITVGTEYGDSDILSGVSASDPIDGEVAVTYVIELVKADGSKEKVSAIAKDSLGKYLITYSAKDKNGNLADTKERTVEVIDDVKPQLSINPNRIRVLRGRTVSNYLYGVTATDNYNTNVTIKHNGPINTDSLGEKTVEYVAKDASGNEVKGTRVYVVYEYYYPPTPPEPKPEPKPEPPTPETPTEPGDEEIIEDDETPLGVVEYFDPYIHGYEDKTFRPANNVTRAELAAMISRILKLNLDEPTDISFSDVAEGKWYTKCILAVSKLGLFNVYEDGTFKPNQAATRAEVSYLFSQYWKYLNIEVNNQADYFTDIKGHWAEAYINQMYNAGVVNGFKDKTFRPDTALKREQVVVIINKLIGRPVLQPESPSFPDMPKEHWAYGEVEAATVSFEREKQE
ncbi:DUF5011 domain-containing protein [Clostridium sp. 'deep sea']|uniref:immunoglobulin-like domain-containing protein n=1 Tax=Clostridium sp. 'deep sea' TaxID=2779445 RepID=UPI00189668BB|nr:immunoglobulin-like domain-containing protein [Clostridium sp. 'deep sea']QOR35502.1 DUF5011 domain-containing protein [Clostridium sp. 'deep sea']